jgi:hypothetical protein
MAETTTLIMACTVRRPSARTATLVIIRMRARRMATGGLATSWTASLSESVRGSDGDSAVDFAVAADSGEDLDFMMAADLVVDLIVVDSLDADSMAGRDLEIGQASPTVADSVVDLPAVGIVASQAAAFTAAQEAFMEAVDSTEVAAVSMVAVVVDSMEVAADTAVATGNGPELNRA